MVNLTRLLPFKMMRKGSDSDPVQCVLLNGNFCMMIHNLHFLLFPLFRSFECNYPDNKITVIVIELIETESDCDHPIMVTCGHWMGPSADSDYTFSK